MLIAPPASDLPFHVLVVSGDKTRVTLLLFVALTEARGGWSNVDYEVGLERGRGSIHATVEAFSKVLPHTEEVRWSLVYAASRGGSTRKAAKGTEAQEMLGDLR